jgi:predicted Zn-dependent protease
MINMPLRSIKRAWSASFLIAFCVLFFNTAQAQTAASPLSKLPTLGDGSDLSSSAERRLGDRIARELYRDPDYLDDAVLSEYVQGIWQPLLAAARLRGDLSPELDERFSWEILLGRDRTVNAFALPGGYFGLHLGLIAVVTSRDELASVLGHELSHVTQRHISRLIARQGQQAPWLIGAMILGALAASKNADAGNALIVGGQAVSAQNQLNFSRDMEREADRVGYGVMTQAGFEPQGFVAMFDKLQQASRLNDNGAFPYLRSHPLTTERMADMQARQLLAPATTQNASPTAEHAMVAQRARVLSNPGVDALQAIAQEARGAQFSTLSTARQAAVLYGSALASSRLREFEQARTQLQRLTDLVRADVRAARLANLLSVEVALAFGDKAPAAALLVMPKGTTNHKPQRPELLLAAQAMSQNPASLALISQALQAWVNEHPRDSQAWQLLSDVFARQNQPLRSLRASAESQVAMLDYGAALDRFKAAQTVPRSNSPADHIDASIIDTRRRQVELLLKEQALDR